MTAKRFKTTSKGYVFDKWIFRIGLVFICLFGLSASLYAINHGVVYVSCPQEAIGGFCYNNYYNTGEFNKTIYKDFSFLDQRETFLAGESYGLPLPGWVQSAHIIILMFSILLFLFNHLKYNVVWEK